MEEPISQCPQCHTTVRPTDYFCYNCGKNLHAKPPSVTPVSQGLLYAGSLLLPPLGIWWALPYLKQPDSRSRTVGWIAVILTVLSLLLAVWYTMKIVNGVTSTVNQQMQLYQGL